jgi:hypothetical protein
MAKELEETHTGLFLTRTFWNGTCDSFWPYPQKSISNWKNLYLPECKGARRSKIAAEVSNGLSKHSEHIQALERDRLSDDLSGYGEPVRYVLFRFVAAARGCSEPHD